MPGMMKTRIGLLLLIAASGLTAFSQCAATANIYAFTFNGKNYEVVREMKTWTDAAACAVERGGYLVEINSASEQAAVYDAIVNHAGVSSTYTSVANGGGIAYVWIGATDQQTEGTWLWDGNNDNSGTNFWNGQGANGSGNGTAVGGAFFNWGGTDAGTPQEPDNYAGMQDHAGMGLAGWPSGTILLGIAGEWNDIGGSAPLYFVVEYDDGTGMNDPKGEGRFEIYPNPSDGKITLYGKVSAADVSVADLAGNRVFVLPSLQSDGTIDLSSLPAGIYFMTVDDGKSTFCRKLLLK